MTQTKPLRGHRRQKATEAAIATIARGRSDEEAIAEVEAAVGTLTLRQRSGVLAEARRLLVDRLRREKDEHRAEALAHYEAVLADDKASVRDRLTARRRIDQLLGLDLPRHTNGSHAGEGRMDEALQRALDAMLDGPELADAAMRLGERLAQRLRDGGNGSVAHGDHRPDAHGGSDG